MRLALGAVGAALLSAALVPALGWPNVWAWFPVLSALLAYATLALGWLRMLSKRRRTIADASLWLWRAAWVHGAVACVLLAWQQAVPDSRILLACGAAYLVGFAGQAINAMLLKIVPFLVWLHRFSRQVGKTPVPLMGDLLPARHARRQAACMIGASALLVLAAAVPSDALARLAGTALIGACGYLEWLLWRAWRTSAAPTPAVHPPPAPASAAVRAS
jgi:hypothetical protein